jgi:hypothetical protein
MEKHAPKQGKNRKKKGRIGNHCAELHYCTAIQIRPRFLRRENIATADHPVWRYRVDAPLTSCAVRMRLVGTDDATPRDQLRTPLDRLLTDAEAWVLECYVGCEELLAGRARCFGYDGDRVDTSPVCVAPLNLQELEMLGSHQIAKKALTEAERQAMAVFCLQMFGERDAPSEAQAGIMFRVEVRDKRRGWNLLLQAIARRLITSFQG